MNAQVKIKPDDTRARIMEVAEALFRRLGFAKTAVADIAAELRMSPANVYRFFPSKNAIVQAICQRFLGELEERVRAVARSGAPAPERLERFVLEILAYHKENLLSEQRVHDMVQVAIEDSWGAIMAHKEVQRTLVEQVLREGIEAGAVEPVDAAETSQVFMRSIICFCHPVLIAQCLQDGHGLEAEARQSVRFLVRAITPKNPSSS